jgi:hypothetical protein
VFVIKVYVLVIMKGNSLFRACIDSLEYEFSAVVASSHRFECVWGEGWTQKRVFVIKVYVLVILKNNSLFRACRDCCVTRCCIYYSYPFQIKRRPTFTTVAPISILTITSIQVTQLFTLQLSSSFLTPVGPRSCGTHCGL